MSDSSDAPHDPYAALRLPQFRFFSTARNLSALGDNMQGVAIGWELYERTRQPLTLGVVGLVQALPIFLFVLLAGHVADNFPRRRVAFIAQAAFSACSLCVAVLSARHAPIELYYVCLFCAATARAFGNPARGALLPEIVPMKLLGSAISWDTTVRRVAVISGAALGGWVLGATRTPAVVYLLNGSLGAASALLLLFIRESPRPTLAREPLTWKTLAAGVHAIFRSDVILATISLDLFAVLLGGATVLLPVFASDVLRVGPEKLGLLRAAPSVGAFATALALAHFPHFRRPGRVMLWSVAGFGAATIVFGLSKSLGLSLAALATLGGFDMVSVVIRQTLLLTNTPNALRGRVNAVNSVFVNSSNEIGGFESGLVAQLFSPIVSVVSGGIGAILVVCGAAVLWPALRRYDTDKGPAMIEEAPPEP
jgi:MFS family permease